MTNEVLERRGMGEDSNNEQEASSAGPRKPSVKKIRQTKSANVASSANQMLLQKRTNKKNRIRALKANIFYYMTVVFRGNSTVGRAIA
jgi:hypothetical protein